MKNKIGQIWEIDATLYILACVNSKCVCFVSLKDGNRWIDSKSYVGDTSDIPNEFIKEISAHCSNAKMVYNSFDDMMNGNEVKEPEYYVCYKNINSEDWVISSCEYKSLDEFKSKNPSLNNQLPHLLID